MDERVTLVLVDGSAAVVPIAAARAIADVLWDMGLTPGAVTAATRITDAITAPTALTHHPSTTQFQPSNPESHLTPEACTDKEPSRWLHAVPCLACHRSGP